MRNNRLLAVSAVPAFLIGMSAPVQSDFPVNAETMVSPRLTVDLNANDGRVASYAHNAENWIIDGETSASKEIGGLTFTLSTETEGSALYGSVNAFRLNRFAFPTAEGYGRFAAGGRGGQVVHVTSLHDDVNEEGTLR